MWIKGGTAPRLKARRGAWDRKRESVPRLSEGSGSRYRGINSNVCPAEECWVFGGRAFQEEGNLTGVSRISKNSYNSTIKRQITQLKNRQRI